MSEELKPCPFCGKWIEKHLITQDGKTIFTGKVSCSNPECWLHDFDFTIEEWQSRPLEDALTAEQEALKAKLEQVKEALEKIDFTLGCAPIMASDGNQLAKEAWKIAHETIQQLEEN